jgi:hypothetical protein
MTDIYFGDLGLIPGEMLQHISEVRHGAWGAQTEGEHMGHGQSSCDRA